MQHPPSLETPADSPADVGIHPTEEDDGEPVCVYP